MISRTANASSDDRKACVHGLREHRRKALAPARQDRYRRPGVFGDKVRAAQISGHHHVPRESEALDAVTQRLFLRSLPNNDELAFRSPMHKRHGFDEIENALL